MRAAETRYARQEGARSASPPAHRAGGGSPRTALLRSLRSRCSLRSRLPARGRGGEAARVKQNGGFAQWQDGACHYKPYGRKTAVLYGSRFGCRRSNVVRRAGKMPCGADSRPAGRVAVAQRRASAKLPDAVKQALRAALFSFPQLFQHPPAPQSCGEQQCPFGYEKRASSQAWKLFFLAYRPDEIPPAK